MPKKNPNNSPPQRERGLEGQGYTIAGYPSARFGIPTIIHSKKATLAATGWKSSPLDCGGLMKPVRIWLNDVPNGFELVLALECQDCRYTDAIRLPYSGHKQLFNSATRRTWALREGR